MKPLILGSVAVLAVAAALYLGGVFDTRDPGPAEQAGARLDDAAEATAEAAKEAGEAASGAVDAAGEAASDAAGEVKRAVTE
ncbi:MAG: hypothetical protein RQ752_04055 [Thermohalobaculum sp.]|nr:hypothetical protein [Thermohalobaculum sp.]